MVFGAFYGRFFLSLEAQKITSQWSPFWVNRWVPRMVQWSLCDFIIGSSTMGNLGDIGAKMIPRTISISYSFWIADFKQETTRTYVHNCIYIYLYNIWKGTPKISKALISTTWTNWYQQHGYSSPSRPPLTCRALSNRFNFLRTPSRQHVKSVVFSSGFIRTYQPATTTGKGEHDRVLLCHRGCHEFFTFLSFLSSADRKKHW